MVEPGFKTTHPGNKPQQLLMPLSKKRNDGRIGTGLAKHRRS